MCGLFLRERLWVARQRTGWGQGEVADLLGVRNASVSDWETGRVTPGGESLEALCKLYATKSIRTAWIMTGAGPLMRGDVEALTEPTSDTLGELGEMIGVDPLRGKNIPAKKGKKKDRRAR